MTGEEGIAAQQAAQRGRPGGYQREVVVQGDFPIAGGTLAISGRLDGCDLTADPPLVEEIKTTRADPAAAERLLGSAHWAQVTLYAALLAREHPQHSAWQLRLLYCHPDTDDRTPFDRTLTHAELAVFLAETVADYRAWLAVELDYTRARNDWLAARPFPYGEFRPHQRALSGRVFQAFRDGERLLLEAPTGSGKTMGVLFPALKALAVGHVARLFYLTSRGTGAMAALDAVRDLDPDGNRVRVVDLTAKEKACPVPGMPCDETCRYANGYFDRIRDAVRDLLNRGHMCREAIQAVGEAHTVCPFELSLDAALWADLIVGDYNYLLDPVVRLQRFAADAELGVLIDESHQLAERGREMLSLELERAVVRRALAESPPAGLAKHLERLDRALMALRRALVGAKARGEVVVDPPDPVLRAGERALEVLADDTFELGRYPQCRALLFDLARWRRARTWTDGRGDDFRHLAEVLEREDGRSNVRLRLVCVDAAAYLAEVLGGYGPHVRFSGTVSPLDLYQSLHGLNDAPAERLESAFRPEQLLTLLVHDLPVYYRQRARTLPHLADLVARVCAGAPGNYLVALPSFAYLTQLAAALAERHPSLALSVQTPGMSEAERDAFVRWFQADGRTRAGLIVLGGIFGESVDFSHAKLAGVVCVGVGLPPASTLRTEMSRHFEARLGARGGEMVAYQQPAMTKVLQMAGRLLRGPDDRGVLCLVDDRFLKAEFQRFFPRHWQPEAIRAAGVGARIEKFWQATSDLPRLVDSRATAALPAVEDPP